MLICTHMLLSMVCLGSTFLLLPYCLLYLHIVHRSKALHLQTHFYHNLSNVLKIPYSSTLCINANHKLEWPPPYYSRPSITATARWGMIGTAPDSVVPAKGTSPSRPSIVYFWDHFPHSHISSQKIYCDGYLGSNYP